MDLHYLLPYSDSDVGYFSCIASICVYAVWLACGWVQILWRGNRIFLFRSSRKNSNKSSNILLFLGL
jgi:hypothetical protein